MSKPKATDGGTRYIPPGSCTWCGHKPHDGKACRSKIRTIRADTEPLPMRAATHPNDVTCGSHVFYLSR